MNVTAHVVVGTLRDLATLLDDKDPIAATVLPPHPLAARIPFRQHPSTPVTDPVAPVFNFKDVLRCSVDREIQARYLAKLQQPPPVENDHIAFDSGRCQYIRSSTRCTYTDATSASKRRVPIRRRQSQPVGNWNRHRPVLTRFAAKHHLVTTNKRRSRIRVSLLYALLRPHLIFLATRWFPTIFMSIEYKVKISSLPVADHARHTAGVFSTGKFAHQGRHEIHVELWTSPCELGDSTDKQREDWRERSVCVAISSQMNLTTDPALNGRRDPARL